MKVACSFLLLLFTLHASGQQPNEPQPPAVDPGVAGAAPSDAIVLFDGKDLSEWVDKEGKPARWVIENGAIVCKSATGHIYSKRKFGSAQIHLEFATPSMPEARGQARGNSGVYLLSRHEIQILDSYNNPTYPKGSSGALYGQYAPLVNASRAPGQWQTYDIVFHAPRCGADGAVIRPGTLTLFHTGVLVQDNVTIKERRPSGACDPGSLMLQDHYHPDVKETFMRFRNIWYRPLADVD